MDQHRHSSGWEWNSKTVALGTPFSVAIVRMFYNHVWRIQLSPRWRPIRYCTENLLVYVTPVFEDHIGVALRQLYHSERIWVKTCLVYPSGRRPIIKSTLKVPGRIFFVTLGWSPLWRPTRYWKLKNVFMLMYLKNRSPLPNVFALSLFFTHSLW